MGSEVMEMPRLLAISPIVGAAIATALLLVLAVLESLWERRRAGRTEPSARSRHHGVAGPHGRRAA